MTQFWITLMLAYSTVLHIGEKMMWWELKTSLILRWFFSLAVYGAFLVGKGKKGRVEVMDKSNSLKNGNTWRNSRVYLRSTTFRLFTWKLQFMEHFICYFEIWQRCQHLLFAMLFWTFQFFTHKSLEKVYLGQWIWTSLGWEARSQRREKSSNPNGLP